MFLLIPPNGLLAAVCALAAAMLLLVAAWRAPWAALSTVSLRQHAWFGAIVALSLFWVLQVNVRDVLAFHPLALTVFTLVFGWELASLGGAVALLANAAIMGRLGLATPVELLLMVLVPVLASVGFIRLLECVKPRNIFVFMLGGGFFGGMVALLFSLLAHFVLFYLFNAEAQLDMLSQYAYLILLMLFPEGFINGALISVLVVFQPELVRAFDDRAYLDS